MRVLIPVIAVFLLVMPAWALAEGRVALVIGNDRYAAVPSLERAVADARAYREQLRDLRGFEVIYAEDADRAQMIARIGQFLARLRPDDIAMVVYSGHGVQLDPNDRNTLYLLPTDIPAVDPGGGGAEFFLDAQAINFARLAAQVEARGASLRVYVLDACRNNPFPVTAGGRSVGLSRGLGRLGANVGEFVFFAASPGELALDYLPGEDSSANSVFTRVFLKHFRPGIYLEDIANDVQAEVLELSRAAAFPQRPYYSDGVAGKACLDEACGVAALAVEADRELESSYWRLCERRDTLAYCQAYLDAFPNGPRAPLARLRVAELQARSEPAVPRKAIGQLAEPGDGGAGPMAPKPPGDVPQSDSAPVQPAAAIGGPGAPPVPTAAEPEQDVAALTSAETKPTDAERGHAAQAREAMQREARSAWAGLVESWDYRAVQNFRDRFPDTGEAAEATRRLAFLTERQREAQRELNRLGYDAGPVDGVWGRRSASAMRAFQEDNRLGRTGRVSEAVLQAFDSAPRRLVPEKRLTEFSPDEEGRWVARSRLETGSIIAASLSRRGNAITLYVDFDHSSNREYDRSNSLKYGRVCNFSGQLGEISCILGATLSSLSSLRSPGGSVSGRFPEVRFVGEQDIGSANLVFEKEMSVPN